MHGSGTKKDAGDIRVHADAAQEGVEGGGARPTRGGQVTANQLTPAQQVRPLWTRGSRQSAARQARGGGTGTVPVRVRPVS